MFGFSFINRLLGISRKKKINPDVIRVHPDRNPNNREVAEELMKLLTSNKHNYSQLINIEKQINEKL